jgi:class 3 adenylate cyclase
MRPVSTGGRLLPYLPRLLLEWDGADRGRFHKRVEGTMAFVDISGFTAMSERLASQGKEGAEEVAEIINSIFARLLAVAYENGGSLLKFGGDALLLFFSGPEHPLRACHAASWMRRRLREIGRVRTSVGVSQLRMHVGVHTGEFDFFVLGSVFHDLLIVGRSATETVAMESAATAGEILVSNSTASHLAPRVLGDVREGGRLLVRAPAPPLVAFDASRAPDGDPNPFIPPRLRSFLTGDVEPDHRRVGIAFVRFEGVDELIERGGPEAALEPLDGLMEAVQAATERNLVTYIDNDVEPGGGKFMLAAGAPYTSERDGEQLLRAVRQILDAHPGLRVRAGVNQGHAFAGLIGPPYRRKYSVMGDVVNLAARLMAKAPEGSILSSPEVLAGATAIFETRALEPFRVKGKAEPVTALDVGAVLRNRRDRDAERAPLVGRGVEMAVLLAALAEAERGTGVLVELVADPGMGKSKLVEELAWQSDDGAFFSVAAEE